MTAPGRVNVNNIYIPNPSRIFVKRGAGGLRRFILGCPKDRAEDPKKNRAEDSPAFDPPGLSRRKAAGRSENQDRANRSAPRLPADLPPTSEACAAPHRRA